MLSVSLIQRTNHRIMDSFDATQGDLVANHGRDRGQQPVVGRSVNLASGLVSRRHAHPTAQFLYAAQGVMLAQTDGDEWVSPPTRGLWVPPSTPHRIRAIGEVHMRTLYFRPDAGVRLPSECKVVGVSPLLRELIVAAVEIRLPYPPDSRDAHLMRLLLDEITVQDSLPLRLPYPVEPALANICRQVAQTPDNSRTLEDWATRLGMHPKTLQRRFLRETGLTFGQWRQQACLIQAFERLAAGEKVVDVALALGYNSPTAFASMFRRHLGVPPSAYFGQRTSRPASK